MKQRQFHLTGYAWNLAAIWLTVAIWRFSPIHNWALESTGQIALVALAIGYTVLGGTFALLDPDPTPSRAQLAFSAAGKWLRGQRAEPTEATSARFVLVKFCFVPLMVNFAILHSFRAVGSLFNWVTHTPPPPALGIVHGGWFEQYGYNAAIAILFLVDTSLFTFGYLFEDKKLANTVRSVEPTLFGWFIAMICYPPYNDWTTRVFEWHSDHASVGSWGLTVAMHVMELALLAIYTWASVALGTRCSNLTNRGTVRSGPYAVVRHPAYISKVAAWWMMALPVWSAVAAASVAAWTVVYTLRALTEERHMERDPEYREYQAQVRWRFIPGLI